MRLTRFALLAAGCIGALYGRALRYPFVYDDRVLIEGSAKLSDPSTLPTALVRDLFYLSGSTRPSPYWRPVVTLSYYLDQLVGGGAPWSFHLTNLLVLLGASVGVFALLRRTTLDRALPLALLFALWPIQVEGACNIAGRTDLLCAAFAAAALLARQPILAASLGFLACGSKEIGVLLPLVSWLLDRRGAWRAHAAGGVAFLVGRAWVLSNTALLPEDHVAPTAASALAAGYRIAWWLGRLILPLPLSPALELPTPVALVSVAAWLLIGLVGIMIWRFRSPERLAGAVLVFGALIPVSGLITSNVRVGDTLLVLPLWGALFLLSERLKPKILLGLCALSFAASWPRVSDWSSERTLWERAHQRVPADPLVRLNLARASRETDPALALSLLDGVSLPERRGREVAAVRAGALLDLGREDEAWRALLLAVKLDDPEAQWANAMACVLGAGRGYPGALALCQAASAQPDPNVFNALGIAQMQAGDKAAGLASFERAASLAPGDPTFAANLARARLELGVEAGQRR